MKSSADHKARWSIDSAYMTERQLLDLSQDGNQVCSVLAEAGMILEL